MNSSELGTILNIPPRTIQDRTLKAAEAGTGHIKIGERHFRFETVRGHYAYEEVFAEVIDTSDNGLAAAWRLASGEKQEEALLKEKLVRDYRNRPEKEGWKKFLARVAYKYRQIAPTKSKLFRWLETVKRCEDEGLTALDHLLDTRGKSSNNRSYSEEMYALMERLFLENPSIRKTKLHTYMQESFGGDTPSYATISRMIARYKAENVLIATLADNPAQANNKLRPAPGNASGAAAYNNALWEMDGTPVDVMCEDGIRYQLSAAIDVYSRRAVVVVTPTANASALGRVFKKGITKLGVPEAVKLDNGKEYKSRTFEYTCSRLKIEQQFTMPYSGWQKPHIERFFGTLTRDLFEELPGYIGHSVAEREGLQNRETYEEKIKARERANALIRQGHAAAKKLAAAQKAADAYLPTTLSREQLEGYIDKWINRYENRQHRGIKETPLARWDECAMPVRRISDERVLDVLTGLSEKKKISKKGIVWKKLSYWHDALSLRVGQSVWALSDDDLGYLYVYDLEMKFICKAENAELVGKSRAEYMASRFFDAKAKRLIAQLVEIRREKPERYLSLIDEAGIRQNDIIEAALEFKSEAVSGVRASLAEESGYGDAEQEALQDHAKETALINGRPIFGSVSERFAFDLENGTVDENTKRLADKNPGLWAMALEEWEKTKAG